MGIEKPACPVGTGATGPYVAHPRSRSLHCARAQPVRTSQTVETGPYGPADEQILVALEMGPEFERPTSGFEVSFRFAILARPLS